MADFLSQRTGKSIEELRPLAESVDPEALDDLFADRSVTNATVRFRHEEHLVTVTGTGEVHVEPVDQE